jgi:hypothetical protein
MTPVRSTQGDVAEFREPQLTALPLEQLLADRFLQPMDLDADRRLREAEFLARLGNAPLFGDDPEVQKVLVIEPFHAATISRSSLRITS